LFDITSSSLRQLISGNIDSEQILVVQPGQQGERDNRAFLSSKILSH
jgi:hypothetical protein